MEQNEQMFELARRCRPVKLDDVWGNKDTVASLRNILAKDVKPQTYLMQGPRGCGKCVTGDTMVSTDEGMYSMFDLFTKHGVYDTGSVDKSIDVVPMAGSYDRTSAFYSEDVDHVQKIKLTNGMDIQGTDAHPLLVLDYNGIPIWKSMYDIEVGDVVVCRSNHRVVESDDTDDESSLEFGRLMGYMVANGCLSNSNRLTFCSNNERIGNDLTDMAYRLDNQRVTSHKYGNKATVYGIPTTLSKQILSWYGDGWNTARYKHVPHAVLRGNRSVRRGFLIGMMECDGTYNDFALALSTASYRMKQEVMSLMQDMGMLCWAREKYVKDMDHVYYDIFIDRQTTIDLYGDYVSLKYDSFVTDRNPNPNKRTWCVPKGLHEGYMKWKHANVKGSGHLADGTGTYVNLPSQESFRKNRITERMAVTYTMWEAQGNPSYEPLSTLCRMMVTEGWTFYSVKSKERVDGSVRVYDLTIPNSHSFIANGIVSHNTTMARVMCTELGIEDVQEINASDRNGVDDIRNLIEDAKYMGFGNGRAYILDECFHKDTLISTPSGMRQISELNKGNEIHNMLGVSVIEQLIENKVLTCRLCIVNTNGRQLLTTIDHLFFTDHGWVEAQYLEEGDRLYAIENMSDMWKDIQSEAVIEDRHMRGQELLQGVSDDCSHRGKQDVLVGRDETSCSREEASNTGIQGTHGNVQESDVSKESNVESTDSGEDAKHQENERNIECLEWSKGWQRSVHYGTDCFAEDARDPMEVRISSSDENAKRFGVSHVIQARPRLSRDEGRNRGGWQRPQLEKSVVARYEENSISGKHRVDGVTFFERDDIDEAFLGFFTGEELSGKYVTMYDISVEGHPSYFANGVLVHNCHMLSASAQSAALKLLEEPRKDVYFFLCTTDPQKLSTAIKSRCTKVDVGKLKETEMMRRLKRVCSDEDLDVSTDVLESVAEASDGVPREALKLLDKVVGMDDEQATTLIRKEGQTSDVTEPCVLDLCRALLGNANWRTVAECIGAVKASDAEGVRRQVLGYMQAVLLKSGKPDAATVMSNFMDNFYDSGTPGLTYACYCTLSDLNRL